MNKYKYPYCNRSKINSTPEVYALPTSFMTADLKY